MEIKPVLIDILRSGQRRLHDFANNLPAEARRAAGTWERWSAKDQVAHAIHWLDHNSRLVRGLEEEQAGEEEEANAWIFQHYQNTGWDEILTLADDTYAALVDFVSQQSEEDLQSSDQLLDLRGRPIKQNIAGEQGHIQIHLASYWLSEGQPQRAADIYLETAEAARPLDPSPAWQGLQDYNSACAYAITGRRDQAMASLRSAFNGRPDLRGFASQDSDLESLYSDPEFLALTQPEDAQNG